MNRKFLSIIFIITAITMIGCSNKQINNKSDANTSTQQSNDISVTKDKANTKSDNTTTDSTSEVNATNKKDNLYNIIKNTYKIHNITIKYPQISNLCDNGKQTEINKLIKDKVIDDYDLTEAIKTGVIPYYNEPIENMTLDVDYTIELQNENMLSIKYLGEGYMKGGIHPDNELHTTNIDINNAKVLKLSDMVKINQTFVNAFRKGSYIPWNKDSNVTQSDILGILNDYDKMGKDSGTTLQSALQHSDNPVKYGNNYSVFSYLEKDGVVISIDVPHAMGDHAELKIPYSDIKDNNVLKNLLGSS